MGELDDEQFELNELNYQGQLYNAREGCEHVIVEMWSGVECARCGGWFCL